MKIEEEKLRGGESHTLRIDALPFRQFADQAPVMIWIADKSGQVVYFNRRWHAYTGVSITGALGDGWLTAVHPDDKQAAIESLDSMAAGEDEKKRLYRLRSMSGEYRWMLDRFARLYESRTFIGYIGSITEVSHSRSNKEGTALDEAKARERDLQRANTELMRANHDLEQYAYISSHDLQEPLRKIRFFTDLLFSRVNRPDDLEILSKIGSSANKMSLLLKDILNYTTLSRGAIQFSEVDLNKVARETIIEYENEIASKNAKVTVAKLPTVQGIYSQLLLVFVNLVGNALTFSKENPTLRITSARVQGREKRHLGADPGKCYVMISFTDNGIGFDEKYTEKIFDIFQRLHANGSHTGNGMGLPLCKKVMENHNGFITARSSAGSGATFEIYIPVLDYNTSPPSI